MACPHSLIGSPDRCSMCLGIPARRVEQAGPELFVDGIAARPIEPRSHGYGLKQAIAGGRQRAMRSAPRTVRR